MLRIPRIFCSCWTSENSGKEGKTLKKTRKLLRAKQPWNQKNKEMKDRANPFLFMHKVVNPEKRTLLVVSSDLVM